MLREEYLAAERRHDLAAQSALLLAIRESLVPGQTAELEAFYRERLNAVYLFFIRAATGAAEDSREIVRWLAAIGLNHDNPLKNYYIGRSYYTLGEYGKAEIFLLKYLAEYWQPDEEAWFYLANARYMMERWADAIEAYEKTLSLHGGFYEAAVNAALLLKKFGEREACRALTRSERAHRLFLRGKFLPAVVDSDFRIDEEDWAAVRRLPIFINARDRLTCLKNLIDWLTAAGYENIIVLDNASTYPPLLAYYDALEAGAGAAVRLVRLGKNLGHTALWTSGILNEMAIATPYAYTDPDLLPIEDCPPNFVQELLRLLRRYPFLKKAAPGLYTADLGEKPAIVKREVVMTEQEKYSRVPLADNLYFGAVDTTFAVYRNIRHYLIAEAARTTGNIMMRHIPWYYPSYDEMPADERYYMDHADKSSTFSAAMRHRNN